MAKRDSASIVVSIRRCTLRIECHGNLASIRSTRACSKSAQVSSVLGAASTSPGYAVAPLVGPVELAAEQFTSTVSNGESFSYVEYGDGDDERLLSDCARDVRVDACRDDSTRTLGLILPESRHETRAFMGSSSTDLTGRESSFLLHVSEELRRLISDWSVFSTGRLTAEQDSRP